MRRQRLSSKEILLLVTLIILMFVILKLQINYTTTKNMIQSYVKIIQSKKLIKNNKTNDFNSSKFGKISRLPIIYATTCNVSRPNYQNLQFDNIYWQTLNTTNGTIKLFSAFYDDRNESDIGPSIRIIAMINQEEIQNVTTYCQFWFNEVVNPIISKTIEYKLMWFKGWIWHKTYLPFLITCPYNFNHYQEIPVGVSLVNKNCEQTENYLKVLNIRPEINVEKKPFAVCVKDFNFDDQSKAIRLIEWIELVRILGADKIFIYQFHATGNIRKVFDYYEQYGILEIVKLSYPKSQSLGLWSNEVVSLNDCFYRNIYLYDYIAIFDVDEIIIPKHPDDMSWLDMFDRIKHNKNVTYSSYIFQNVYFLDNIQHNHNWDSNIPQYLHILKHVIRLSNYTARSKETRKSFHDTEIVKTVNNHFALSCFNGHRCIHFQVNTKFGNLAHYRQSCPDELIKVCKYYQNYTTEDKTVWKYKDKVIKQSSKVINMLKLIKDNL